MKDLSMHIMDIVQNSIRAKSSLIKIFICEDKLEDIFEIFIEDDGYGIDANDLNKVMDPFFTSRTTRKVGLGISLLKQNAELTNGYLEIKSEKNKGTKLKAVFSHKHIDRPILGDISSTVALMAGANPELDFIYKHKTNKGEYIFNTIEVKDVLGGVSISDPNIITYLKEMIQENLNELE
ncbi:MAG: ATP-binding protein [Marinifilaceae bacterium]|jgi:anti-sigma regulatory factor (Ser/Thr protein kinase)|nr:ATP-binding protein [Marinifilaceae bacterium]